MRASEESSATRIEPGRRRWELLAEEQAGGDQKPGDTNGEGVNAFGGLWYALSSAGNQIVGSAPNSGIGY
jgi:hypothetical protein